MAALDRHMERTGAVRAGRWAYHDAHGEPIALVVRYDLPTAEGEKPKKTFRPVSLHESKWAWADPPRKWPLYRLTELLAAECVHIVEGEKVAEAARSIGIAATTSAHGSGGAEKTDWTPLAGKQCVLLPDNDRPGRRYADSVARELMKLSPAPVVKVVHLPDLPVGGDLVELIEGLGGAADRARAEIDELVAETEPYEAERARRATDRFRPFPVDVLPEPLRELVTVGAKTIGCDPCYLGLPALVVAAGAIGNSYRVVLKRGWSEPAVLWAGIVGESGTLKSPAIRLILKPLRDAQQSAMQEYKEQCKEYELRLANYEAEKSAWKKKRQGDAPLRPDPPALRRSIVADVTVEAIAPILLDNPRGVVAARDELAAWVNSFDRYASGRGSDAPNWLSMYDADTVIVDRKTGPQRTIYVPAAAVSVIGSIQPAILARSFSIEHRESGLLARLLLAMPPARPAFWTDAEVPEAVETAYAAMVDRLLGLSPDVDDDGRPHPRCIPLDDQARAIFIEWHDEHAIEMAGQSGDLAAAFSKIKGVVARLALVLHCVRVAAEDASIVNRGCIDGVSMRSAITIAEWLKNEIRRVYDVLSETDEERDRRRLIELIERKGGSVTPREVMRSSRMFRTTGDARDALDELAELGLGELREIRGPNGGRPSERFELVDSVDVDETSATDTRPVDETPVDEVGTQGFVNVNTETERQDDEGRP